MKISRKSRVIEKLSASRSKLFMEALAKGSGKDRKKYNRLLNQMREGVNKGRTKKLPEDASFTEVYRAMQEAPKVSEKSLKLKDDLTRRVVGKLDVEKKPLQLKRGLTAEVERGRGKHDIAFRPAFQGSQKNFYRYARAQEKPPIGTVRAYTGRALPPGEVYAGIRHEIGEATEAAPTLRNILTKGTKKKIKKKIKKKPVRKAILRLRKQGKRAKRLYPKGQGKSFPNIVEDLAHFNANPLLGERMHTAGKINLDRSKGVPSRYKFGSEKAEQILRNVGNVGGYTPPPGGRAAGKANIQLERALKKAHSRLKKSIKRQAKRSGPVRGDIG